MVSNSAGAVIGAEPDPASAVLLEPAATAAAAEPAEPLDPRPLGVSAGCVEPAEPLATAGLVPGWSLGLLESRSTKNQTEAAAAAATASPAITMVAPLLDFLPAGIGSGAKAGIALLLAMALVTPLGVLANESGATELDLPRVSGRGDGEVSSNLGWARPLSLANASAAIKRPEPSLRAAICPDVRCDTAEISEASSAKSLWC